MARRHGVLVSDANEPRWNLGVWQVFDPWVNPHLQALQGHTVPAVTRPLTIEFHFRRVVLRLVRSLARLFQRVRQWDSFLEAGGLASPRPELAVEVPEEGGIAADSVFHYLNLFIDDLARIISFVLVEDETEAKEPDSFSALKRMLNDGEFLAIPSLRDLFTELDCEDSWWFQGFRRGAGIRQRLTHYTDLVSFRGTTKPGERRMSCDISLISVGGPTHVADFEICLQEFLRKLCDWLDRLDRPLLLHLSAKLAAKGVPWDPINEECPAVRLPRPEGMPLDSVHYLYLPVYG